MTDTLTDAMVAALDAALEWSSNVNVEPVALFWPDETRQFALAIPYLRAWRRVLTLGDHEPDIGSGPAIWLRCAIAGTLSLDLPDGPPIVYLPGVSRSELRNVHVDNASLAPLASLLYRGQWFDQPNSKDWTVRALLANTDKGLSLDVARDDDTATGLVDGIDLVLDAPVTYLANHHIDAAFIHGLMNPDFVDVLLGWMNDPGGTHERLGPAKWGAFVTQCRTDYAFDPAKQSPFDAAAQLGTAEGTWDKVWRAFRLNAADYPEIPGLLRQAEPSELFLPNPGAWPDRSAKAEEDLRAALTALTGQSESDARKAIAGMETEHAARGTHVWADLGWTPLVFAIEHLAFIAAQTTATTPGDTITDINHWYATHGWKIDSAALDALAAVDRKDDVAAVAAALAAIYEPWLDRAARALQDAVAAHGATYQAADAPIISDGQIIMFIDGLRLDIAHRLVAHLEPRAVDVDLTTSFAALPTVTQTSKPALVPIGPGQLAAGTDLNACRSASGAKADVAVLRSLLKAEGIQILTNDETGDPIGRAWTETGEIDHLGHDRGVSVVHELDDQVRRIGRRITDLFEAGWTAITIVTDHGWLLVPSTMPKNESLPVAVTLTKKGRCARIKMGAQIETQTVPWYWDPDVSIAVAHGISCFEANQVYDHGGVSPHECVVPRIQITASAGADAAPANLILTTKWSGLILHVGHAALPGGATIDLRCDAGDAGSSIAQRAAFTKSTDKVMLVVDDEDLEGQVAQLVVVDSDGMVLAQQATTVGQNP